jgi:hypothetical protein
MKKKIKRLQAYKVREINTVGILLSPHKLKEQEIISKQVENLIKFSKKNTYIVIAGEVNLLKLANIKEVEMWICSSFLEISMLKSCDCFVPTITTSDAEIIFRNLGWQNFFDHNSVVPINHKKLLKQFKIYIYLYNSDLRKHFKIDDKYDITMMTQSLFSQDLHSTSLKLCVYENNSLSHPFDLSWISRRTFENVFDSNVKNAHGEFPKRGLFGRAAEYQGEGSHNLYD